MHYLAESLRSQLHAMGEWPLRRSVLLSISGGLDSVSLLHAMLEAGIRPALFHCNYRLRGEDSTLDAVLVASLADQHSLHLETIQVPDHWKMDLDRRRLNLQDAARRFRYQALSDLVAEGGKIPGAIVATAHHAMDQAETLLLALFKGRNLHRLSGLQSDTNLWRPWLDILPSELEDYAQANTLTYRHDQSNDSDHYDRNYVRLHLAPLLEKRFPGWVRSVLRVSRQIKEGQDVMECVSKDRLESFVVSKNDPYRGRVLRLLDPSDNPSTLPAFGPAMAGNLWRLLGANYSEEAALEKAWDLPVGKILACGRGRVFRQRDSLCYFEKSPASEKCILEWKSQNKAVLDVPGPGDQGNAKAEEQVWLWQAYAELGHEFSLTDPSGMPLDRHKALDHGWTIRPWMPGDRCAVNKGKMKLVSDLLQEHRIERPFKDSWPLICLNGRSVGCPLPSMTNRWESVEGEFAIQWRWNSTLVYAYGH